MLLLHLEEAVHARGQGAGLSSLGGSGSTQESMSGFGGITPGFRWFTWSVGWLSGEGSKSPEELWGLWPFWEPGRSLGPLSSRAFTAERKSGGFYGDMNQAKARASQRALSHLTWDWVMPFTHIRSSGTVSTQESRGPLCQEICVLRLSFRDEDLFPV